VAAFNIRPSANNRRSTTSCRERNSLVASAANTCCNAVKSVSA